jgi:hypothetical protein
LCRAFATSPDDTETEQVRSAVEAHADDLRDVLLELVRGRTSTEEPEVARYLVDTLLGPLDAVAATTAAVELLNNAIDRLDEADEDELDAPRASVEAAMRVVRRSALRRPNKTAKILHRAGFSSRAPTQAGELLVALEDARAFPTSLPPALLRMGAMRTRRAALAAAAFGVARAPLEVDEIEAILEGFSARRGWEDEDFPALRSFIHAQMSRVPVVEQLGLIALEGGVERAEAMARGIQYGKELERSLFTNAKRVLRSDPDAAARRYRYARAWKGAGKKPREVASKGFTEAFGSVKNASGLAVVLQATLEFFDSPESIPKIGNLRSAGLAAVDRVKHQLDEPAKALVSQAMTQLRWDVSEKAGVVERIRRIAGF